MTIDVFFIGSKKNPYYMVEINRKNKKIVIYKPDKLSLKCKDFCEKYYLGELIYDIDYCKIIYMKKDLIEYTELCNTFYEGSFILSEMVIKTNKTGEYFLLKDKIYTNK